MIRLCIILVVFAFAHSRKTLADDHFSPRKIDGEHALIDGDPDPEERRLFDFPISRALGIEIQALSDPSIPRPSIRHLATSTDAGDTIKAADAPIVYYDVPPSHDQSRSIWR